MEDLKKIGIKLIKAFNLASLLLLISITSTMANAAQNKICSVNKDHGVYQNTLSTTAGCINFHFNQKTNEVWLGMPNLHGKKYVVVKIPSGRSPALNGEVEYMGFFAPESVTIGKNEYIPLLYSMRTHDGGFGGECGGGVESFLTVINITTSGHITKPFSKLISSCTKALSYNENATRQQNGAVYVQGEYIYRLVHTS
ncbi:hypothetical protein [Sulfuriferula thiophila]|uniref:hypothetical protein n=1 Tax=Sulfuriferula thiophila TaxID=1781211 RepID=UPI000F6098E5|nr:hypothetical protein [Sulfuriferula thiophila]